MAKKKRPKEKRPKKKALVARRGFDGEIVQRPVGVKKALRLREKDERAGRIRRTTTSRVENEAVTSACNRIIGLMQKRKTDVETRFSRDVYGGKLRESLERLAQKLRPKTVEQRIAEEKLAKLRGSTADYETIIEELKTRESRGRPGVEAGIVRKVSGGTGIPFEVLVKALEKRRIEIFEAEHFRQKRNLAKQKRVANAVSTVRNRIRKGKEAGVDKKGPWVSIGLVEAIAKRKGISFTALELGLIEEGVRTIGERKSKEQREWLARR